MRMSSLAAALACSASLLVPRLASQNPRDVQVLGAPTIGRTVTVRLIAPQQSVTDQDRYYLMLSPHTDAVSQFPPVTRVFGSFKLNRSVFFFVLIAGITNTRIDLPAAIPNDTSIVGLSVDLQYADQSVKNNRIDLSDEAVVTVLAAPNLGGGVGTSLIAEGSRTFSKGFAVGKVDNTNVGKPTVLNTGFNYDREVQYSMGDRGFVQGMRFGFANADHHADLEVFSGGRYVLDARSGSHGFSPLVLPDGRRLAVVRDAKNPTQFLGVVFDPAKGTVTEISGSRASNLSGINNVYASLMGLPIFNGNTFSNVVAVFRDNDVVSSGHQDQVFLWRIDNSKWPATANKLPGEGTPVLDVSYRDQNGKIPLGWNVHEFGIYPVNDGVIFRVNGVTGPIGTSNWDYWWVPYDGSSAAKHFAAPKNGTKNTIWWLYGYTYRTSRDGKNLAVPSGSNSTDARTENDIQGFYNITAATMAKGTAGPLNLTGFPKSTPVEPFFGNDRERTFYLDYSPDGELIAFIKGNQKPGANLLYVTKADGSTAGKLVPVKTGSGGLPVPPSGGVVHMSHVHWRNNSELVVFAGVGSTVMVAQSLMDLYHVKLDGTNPHDGSKATVTKMTSAGDIDVRWSLALKNAIQTETLFFGRDYDAGAKTTALELVAYAPVTNRLFSLTGKEFTTGIASMELDPSTEKLEFRQRPGSSEIYFLGRPWSSSTSKVPDMNVYKFDAAQLAPGAVAVTGYTGSGAASSAVNIHSLVVLSDGSVAYVAVKGLASATNKEVVTFWKAGASSPVALGRFARGSVVMPGSLFAQEKIGGAAGVHGIYWVQGEFGSQSGFGGVVVENTRAYFARTDDLLKGHPIQLTGQPSPANDTGYIQFLGVDPANK